MHNNLWAAQKKFWFRLSPKPDSLAEELPGCLELNKLSLLEAYQLTAKKAYTTALLDIPSEVL